MKSRRPELCHPALKIVFCSMAQYIQCLLHGEMSFSSRHLDLKSIILNSVGSLSVGHSKLGQIYQRKFLSGGREMC